MHEGHRERLISKLIANTDSLSSHEVLEILLFYSIPRKNTNGLAHKLLDTFGDLSGVFSANYDALIAVEGIGHKTATFLTTLKAINNRIEQEKPNAPVIYSYDSCKSMLINSFRGATEEKFVALFLNKNGMIITRKIFSSHSDNMVNFDLNELLKGVISMKPVSAVICHNHISGTPLPSYSDDKATEKIYLTLKLNNVVLYDHIIVSGDKTFSYRVSDRLSIVEKNISKLLY
jgi:DNA repair protein RadC